LLLSLPRWYAELGKKSLANEKETSMRFYTNQHKFYCGIDLHARSMYVCLLSQDGEILLHRNMQAAPEPFLKAVAPYRDGLVVAVECIFTWYWLRPPLCGGGVSFLLGACPREKSHSRREGQKRQERFAKDCRLASRRYAPTGLCLSGCDARHPCSAEAPHPPEAQTRCTLGPCAQSQ